MAEFKLGRIRFVWKSDWAASTVYYKDDIVRNGGNTYVCINGHSSSSDFPTDAASYWNIISDGQEWKSDWAPETYYKQNDIVKYGGQLYIANTAHTSATNESPDFFGLEVNLSDWDLYAESFDYTAEWQVGTKYKVNDIARYNSTVYICTQAHISADNTDDGLEIDQEKWNVFTKGIEWRTTWATATRYKVNDVVKYGGQIYVCNEGHTSAATDDDGLEVDQSKWDYFHKGIEFKSDWATATRYKVNDVVKSGGGLWICVLHHTSQSYLSDDESKWAQFVEGLEFEDSWLITTRYQAGDVVTYGGYSYIAITNNVGKIPTSNPTDWDLFTTGFRFLGEWDEDSSDYEYKVGDVVRLGGYSYLCIADHGTGGAGSGQRPPNATYWERLNSGIYWKANWVDATYYDAGDAVRYGDNSYICVLEHTSDEITLQNRPDQDVTGTNWNVLAAGPEVNVLTTDGDIVYYGGAGPTRLPIGQPGQTLVVNSTGDAPEWKYLGALNNIVYVSSDGKGVDLPAPNYGVTLDRPFKTVRYATEQVAAGTLRYNAKNLITLNRSFIQAEVVEWVNYQIANPTGIWVGFTNSDIDKCRRDVGQIIDAIVWDMSHGGNERTRLAAKSYFDAGVLIAAIADEEEQLVEALTYAIEVVDAVLSNVAPAANYQTLNSVASPITQVVDVTFIEETDAQASFESYLSVITTALTAGVDDDIPTERKPQNTVFVKTGEFEEVLPIIVPENTAVVGDELRSTRIVPAASLVNATDATYSLGTINRLKTIISDIVTDPGNVTKTTGNALDPVTTRPVGSLGSTAAVTSVVNLTTEMVDILTNGVGNADALVFTDTGVTAKTTARTELQTNRATIISDLIAWITSTYPGLVYDQTKCERDTGYIVDAISYDIQYGGNSATLVAANAYFVGAVAVLPAGQTVETAAALNQLSVIVNSYLSGATEETEAAGLLQIIEDVVTAESISGLPSEVTPDITWTSAAAQASHAALITAKSDIQSSALGYVTSNWPTLEFTRATCSRDVGLIVDALAYDTAFGSNYRSITAGLAYYRATASAQLVLAEQLDATIGIVNFIKYKAKLIATAGAGALAETLMQEIYNYIDFKVNANGELPHVTGTNAPNTSTDYTYGVESLEANRNFLVAEANAFIADTYSDTATDTTVTSDVITISDTSWMLPGTAVVFGGTTFGGITAGVTYYVLTTPSSTTFTVSETRGGTVLALSTASGSMTVDLAYSVAACSRDVHAYIDALKNDLTYIGSYKSLLAARYYANAVNGSLLEDMFYLRNGTGLRNCTIAGLTGTLSTANAYGTKRPTAGAFVSLDPGWGTTHTAAWITNKSPYVQNVTTFGTGCVGCKIDGALHDGGNDSIVSNDFTQILSDGIGVWCTNLGRTELVSVFSYYGHIGYLAENGGKIRATNGNSSYGAFGTVAEGIDITEVPVTGTVTNQYFDAIVQTVFTDGSEILAFEYLNAGVNYTAGASAFVVIGEGYGAAIDQVQTVDGGVFEVRLLDTDVNGDSTGDFGGEDYATASSVAQSGNATQITLSNTDVALSSQYVGMMIYIVAGVGAGQYGYINSYNAGTKLATIYKDSDGTPGWDHLTGAAIESVLDGTTTYSVEPRITFTAPPSGLYADTAKGRAVIADGKIARITIHDPGVGYLTAPTVTITDPNNTVEAPTEARIGDGVLAQPTWLNRGTSYTTAQATVTGDGYADLYQPGTLIRVEGLTGAPLPGSNITFGSLPGQYFKLVAVRDLIGSEPGPYTAQLQISPEMSVTDAPQHADTLEFRIRYSQVRLTGHDFLDIGTGNFTNTNYPNIPLIAPDSTKETVESGGGRTFFTSTDQDGNFRVGGLFSVEQATGIATLNADAFNISGLQELSLGELGLGGTGAVITEFSTDGTFTANSDNIVPTQKAIKTYITSQIGGGAATLNVNTITAGQIEILADQISTTTGNQINMLQKVNFTKGVDGIPIAMNYFLLG